MLGRLFVSEEAFGTVSLAPTMGDIGFAIPDVAQNKNRHRMAFFFRVEGRLGRFDIDLSFVLLSIELFMSSSLPSSSMMAPIWVRNYSNLESIHAGLLRPLPKEFSEWCV